MGEREENIQEKERIAKTKSIVAAELMTLPQVDILALACSIFTGVIIQAKKEDRADLLLRLNVVIQKDLSRLDKARVDCKCSCGRISDDGLICDRCVEYKRQEAEEGQEQCDRARTAWAEGER